MENLVEPKPLKRRITGKQRPNLEGRATAENWVPAVECESEVSNTDVGLIDLFVGISSLRVAMAAAGYNIRFHLYVENNGAAMRVVRHCFPEAVQHGYIRPLVAEADEFANSVWSMVRKSDQQFAAVVLAPTRHGKACTRVTRHYFTEPQPCCKL